MDVDLDHKQLLSIHNNANRHRTLGATLSALASSVFLLLAASTASAATLNVSGGQLLGASGVIVDGSSYDVAFLDGTCIALYSGCDAVSDFAFQSLSTASLASVALLDQVFQDGANLFDSDPELTVGCTSLAQCQVRTPYGLTSGLVLVVITVNREPPLNDGRFSASFPRGQDLTGGPLEVYAVWTPVPEPGTATLMGLGLIALSVRNRRQV
jgi:hypothetical protein